MISENAKQVLANRNFFKLWLCQALSIFVASFLCFALVVRIFEFTSASVAVALFWVVYQLPTIILGLVAGAFVDYFPKRRILILTNLVQGTVAFLFLALGAAIWPLFGLVFLYSLIDEFFRPAQESSLPGIVSKNNLHFANSFMVLTLQGSALAGTLAAGPIMKLPHGRVLPFLVGPLFLFAAASLAALIPPNQIKEKLKNREGNGLGELLKDLKEGIRFIKQTPKVRTPLLLFAIFQTATAGLVVLGPAIANRLFNLDLRDTGLALILPTTIGAAAASLLVDRLITTLGKRRLTQAGFILTGTLIAAAPLLEPQLKNGWGLAAALAFLLGAGAIAVMAPLKTAIQVHSPPDIRGRVFGALRTLTMLTSGVTVFISSAIADLVGLRIAIETVSAAALVLGLILLQRKDAF